MKLLNVDFEESVNFSNRNVVPVISKSQSLPKATNSKVEVDLLGGWDDLSESQQTFQNSAPIAPTDPFSNSR